MVTDNYHHDRCPHLDYIKALVLKKGFKNIVEGTFQSENATKKRAAGIYKDYELQSSNARKTSAEPPDDTKEAPQGGLGHTHNL